MATAWAGVVGALVGGLFTTLIALISAHWNHKNAEAERLEARRALWRDACAALLDESKQQIENRAGTPTKPNVGRELARVQMLSSGAVGAAAAEYAVTVQDWHKWDLRAGAEADFIEAIRRELHPEARPGLLDRFRRGKPLPTTESATTLPT